MKHHHRPHYNLLLAVPILLLVLIGLFRTLALASAQSGQTEIQPELPTLILPNDLSVQAGQSITIPIQFESNEHNIAVAIFSLDIDEACLRFDPIDEDDDGQLDNVTFNVSPAFNSSATFDGDDLDGELDFTILDTFPPLASLQSGVLATITFDTICTPKPGEVIASDLLFSSDPAVSFGNTAGKSVAAEVVEGSIQITNGETRPTDTPTSTLTPSATSTPTSTPSVTLTSTNTSTSTPTQSIDDTLTPPPTSEPDATVAVTPIPTVTVAPSLSSTHTIGAPGSYFLLRGENFPREGEISIRHENNLLLSLNTEQDDHFKFVLDTRFAQDGMYTITATLEESEAFRGNSEETSATIMIDKDATQIPASLKGSSVPIAFLMSGFKFILLPIACE
ncbi:MAG: hypothetical protein AAF702_39420 [Chloroflexota bacterium]